MSETAEKVKKPISSNRRENIILSSVLFNKGVREYAIQNPVPTQYLDNRNVKKIIEIFNGLVGSNLPPTIEMILEQYYPDDNDEMERQRLSRSLKELKQSCPPVSVDMFKEHLYFIKKYKNLYALEQILHLTQQKIQEERKSPSYDKTNVSYNFIQSRLEQLLDDFSTEEIKSLNLSAGLKKQLETIKVRRKNPEIKDSVPSGYSVLNDVLSGGYQKGNFHLICARPAMGKTVFMLNQAIEAAKNGTKVLFISIEMTLEQCLQRILSKVAQVPLKHILQPEELSESSIAALDKKSDEATKLYGNRLFIEEVKTINSKQLESRIKFYQKHFGVELVFVDYIQIMRTRDFKQPKEVSDYSEISSDLREIAKGTGVALVLGAQLGRDVEKREDKRPIDSDLKNSGSFEQDAATIIHLYRDAVYNKDTEDKNVLEVIVGKNRFGQGNQTIYFTHDYSCQSVFYVPAHAATAA